ncbi:MAG: tripartite tricarboxylate transporter substrate-binding protein [Alphaproteobacteria bacterium]|nr:tripartite tricarboxylate transporter substrate-binding protein [Alphaproteobacteria bacterium]
MEAQTSLIKQHLIDPEICIRCNTCETICPVGAITHDSMNYVVKADMCNSCMDCISPCPTGSIDNWRWVPKTQTYSIEEQLKWHELPQEKSLEELQAAGVSVGEPSTVSTPARLPALPNIPTFAELGFPSMTGSQWLGLSAPKNIPAPIAQKLTALMPEILAKPDIASRLEELQTLPRKTPVVGDDFVKLIRSQIDGWTKVAKRANVQVMV